MIGNIVGKRVVIILNNGFKYEGTLLDKDDQFYQVDDIKQGVILLPITSSMLRVIEK